MSDTKKQELLQQLEDCVLEMEDDTAAAVAQEYVAAGYSAYEDHGWSLPWNGKSRSAV